MVRTHQLDELSDLLNHTLIQSLKAFKNTLFDSQHSRIRRLQINDEHVKTTSNIAAASHYKSMFNFAYMQLLAIICQPSLSSSSSSIDSIAADEKKTRFFFSESMCNLADLLLEQVLLDSYYVDSQWAAPTAAGDSASSDADNLDAEVEAIKYFIERLVSSYPLFVVVAFNSKIKSFI